MNVIDEIAGRERRLKVFFPATISDRQLGERRVHILDLSRGGARLHVNEILRLDQKVSLDIFGTKHSAQIVWLAGKQAGVSFLFKLPTAELDAIECTRIAHLKHAADRIGARLDQHPN